MDFGLGNDPRKRPVSVHNIVAMDHANSTAPSDNILPHPRSQTHHFFERKQWRRCFWLVVTTASLRYTVQYYQSTIRDTNPRINWNESAILQEHYWMLDPLPLPLSFQIGWDLIEFGMVSGTVNLFRSSNSALERCGVQSAQDPVWSKKYMVILLRSVAHY